VAGALSRIVRSADRALSDRLPESLQRYMRDACGVPLDDLITLPGGKLPEPARQLLAHAQDMTSTLAAHHGSALRVEVLRRAQDDTLYFREVFLRTQADDRIVEYGVIAIALEQFTPPQREAILAGQIPLGELLHRFRIPFVSSPIGYFAVSAASFGDRPFAVPAGATCHGRFNRLGKPTGETLAWILEILPPA
jgi:hypothetical protein